MIYRDKKTQAFLLSGKNYSYAMYVNRLGMLQNLHYGAKIEKADLDYLAAHIADPQVPQADDINRDMAADVLPSEYGYYARGDYREPTAIVERSDGAVMSQFTYVSHKVQKGAPAVPGLPHMRSADETLSIVLRDAFSDTEITLHYTVCDDSDVLVRNAEIANVGKQPIVLQKAFSFCVDLSNAGYDLLRLTGNWAAERSVDVAPLGKGITRIQSLRGISSAQFNPFVALLKKACTEEQGECYGFQLVYSGSFALSVEADTHQSVRVQGGVADTAFSWTLDSGERFVAPQAALCYSAQGLGGLSRAYADCIRERIVHPKWAYHKRPIVVNNWEATYFDFTAEKLFPIIDEAAKLGIDTFVLDDGWFGKRDSDRSGLGDWTINEKKLNGGLHTVIDRCKQRGLRFGLWFEPEMVNEDSDLFRKHPDYALAKAGVEPCRSRFQLLLDFTRADVVDYIFASVSKVIKEHDIAYVKWDMNRYLTECYSAKLPADRQGEFMHRYILGVYDLAERLTSAFPDVFFEGCASGGARFDAGAAYYFPQTWTSDNTDAYDRTKIQWGTSLCYPLSTMSCHVSACPNHQTGRTLPLATRGAIASLGATGYELDLSKLTDAEKAECKRQVEAYGRIADLVLTGDLYRLCDPFTDNEFCVMVVSKDKSTAYVVGERFRTTPRGPAIRLPLTGLDAAKTYYIEELDATASGKALRSVGATMPDLHDGESFAWHIREVKH